MLKKLSRVKQIRKVIVALYSHMLHTGWKVSYGEALKLGIITRPFPSKFLSLAFE